jgi:tetratricopeptide (TPR) repeat protein
VDPGRGKYRSKFNAWMDQMTNNDKKDEVNGMTKEEEKAFLEDPTKAATLHEAGWILLKEGKFGQAKFLFEHALTIRRKFLGDEHPDTTESLNDMGSLFFKMGDYAAAKPYFEQALAIRRKVLGDGDHSTAGSVNNMAYLLLSMGDYAGAKMYYEQALVYCLKVLGEQHQNTALVRGYLAKIEEKLKEQGPEKLL